MSGVGAIVRAVPDFTPGFAATGVLLSVFLHGVTAYPLSRYWELLAAARERYGEEHRSVSELPVRIRHAAAGRGFGSAS